MAYNKKQIERLQRMADEWYAILVDTKRSKTKRAHAQKMVDDLAALGFVHGLAPGVSAKPITDAALTAIKPKQAKAIQAKIQDGSASGYERELMDAWQARRKSSKRPKRKDDIVVGSA